MPGVSLDDAIDSLAKDEEQPNELAETNVPGNAGQDSSELATRQPGSQATPPLVLNFDTIEALEWDESSERTAVADGIGSLTIHERASGYLGPQSGSALLRYLQFVNNFLVEEGSSWTCPPLSTPEQNIPSPHVQPSLTTFQRQCLDWYFAYFHTAYPLLHEGYFRAQYMGMKTMSMMSACRALYG